MVVSFNVIALGDLGALAVLERITRRDPPQLQPPRGRRRLPANLQTPKQKLTEDESTEGEWTEREGSSIGIVELGKVAPLVGATIGATLEATSTSVVGHIAGYIFFDS